MFNYGVLKSISDSWYVLPPNKQILFPLFVWGISIPLVFYQNEYLVYSFIGLLFTGAAPMYRLKYSYTNIVHIFGAIFGTLFSFIGVYDISGNYSIFVLFLILIVLLKIFKIKNFIWWLEYIAFICVMISIYLSLIKGL